MNDLYTIAGYVPMSPQLIDEVVGWKAAFAEIHRLERIGPIHGPPIPVHIVMRRRLGGHPCAPIRRAP